MLFADFSIYKMYRNVYYVHIQCINNNKKNIFTKYTHHIKRKHLIESLYIYIYLLSKPRKKILERITQEFIDQIK